MTYDNRPDAYAKQNLFPSKLEKANKFLAKADVKILLAEGKN